MGPIAGLADQVRKERKPAAKDNPFLAMQENVSRQIVAGLDAWRDMTESLAERTFLAIYGLPSLQSAVGVDPAGTRPLRKAAKNPLHQELLQKRIAELRRVLPWVAFARLSSADSLCRHGPGRHRRTGI